MIPDAPTLPPWVLRVAELGDAGVSLIDNSKSCVQPPTWSPSPPFIRYTLTTWTPAVFSWDHYETEAAAIAAFEDAAERLRRGE